MNVYLTYYTRQPRGKRWCSTVESRSPMRAAAAAVRRAGDRSAGGAGEHRAHIPH